MTICQIVESLNPGDAIGNDVLAIKHVIEGMNIKTCVYATSVSPKIKEKNVYTIDKMHKLSEDDIVFYHMGNGSPLNKMVSELNCRKIMYYHNITPPHFFNIDNPTSAENCRKGLRDMREVMKGSFTSYLAVSQFNKSDMVNMGYKADSIDVIPIVVPFDDYRREPDRHMVKRFSDGCTNIVFVGRIAPNKKHEDLIRIFAYYKENVDPEARLILAGGADPNGMYFADIQDYIRTIGVKDVIFPGHISFEEILAIYKTADVFLCMSEHEGFCVPLLEAMTFDVPIIAYDSCAVPETMGGSGIVLDDKDPAFVSRVIKEVVTNKNMRDSIIAAQRRRLEDFSYETIKKQLEDYFRRFLDSFPPISSDGGSQAYRKLYDITNENMKKAGKTLDFSADALLACADRDAENTDITRLINRDLPVRSLIESSYIALTNKLPEKDELARWESEAAKFERSEFVKRLISSLIADKRRISANIRVSCDPFAALPTEGGEA